LFLLNLVFCSLLLLNDQNHIIHYYLSTFPNILSSFLLYGSICLARTKVRFPLFIHNLHLIDRPIYRSIDHSIHPSIHLYMKQRRWCSEHNIYKYSQSRPTDL
jgi:hypothetical protein